VHGECCLIPYLNSMGFSVLFADEFVASTSGVSLSGGQKARVALARAVYAGTKYVLLDDPLSAVVSCLFHLFRSVSLDSL
jgi:ABC-type uncharacterized transport system YnjBCD ATPase subunit